MKQPKITLLICTHNGERTIEKALEAIANQIDVSRDLFEVLVIDNASNDRTSEIAKTAIRHFNLNGQVLLEPRIGKINAFLRGVREAQGELINIIDDDNFIEPDFIHYTLDIFERYPEVGMTGSKNHIVTEQSLPSWFTWVSGRYACSQPWLDEIEQQDHDGVVIARTANIVGAGSTFRSEPLLSCLEKEYNFFNDTQRGKNMKVTGEDLELCWLFRGLGYKFAYDSRVRIRHAIKADRLTLKYFKAHCRILGAGTLGIDPFMFTCKHTEKNYPFQWTWQWQLLSKIKRYLRLIAFPENLGTSKDERQFRNWMAKEECLGAILRILTERSNYTNHIYQVANGKWTELRVR